MNINRRSFNKMLAGAIAGMSSLTAIAAPRTRSRRRGGASVYKPCDAYQGFNFSKNKNTRVGFINSLQIGSVKEMKSDIKVADPMNPNGGEFSVHAVLHEASWGLQQTGPLKFAGQIGTDNKKSIDIAKENSMTKIDTIFQFCVYEYDRSAKKYYKAFHSDDRDMKGRIEKNGDELNLSIGDVPWTGVLRPENYSFEISIVPESVEQDLHMAVSERFKVVRKWGVADRD